MARGRRRITDQVVAGGGLDHPREIARGRHVVARQAGGIGEARARHAEALRLPVHRRDAGLRAAGIMPGKRRRSAILRGHQR